MANLKQISVRIDPKTIQLLDEFTKQRRWRRRNSVINQILKCVMHAASSADIEKMMWFYPDSLSTKFKISVEKSEI